MNFSISFVQTKICLGVFVFNCWFTRKKCVGANPEFVVTIVICHNHCAIDWRAAAVEARAGETLLCQYFAIVWHFAGVSVWATGRRPFRQLLAVRLASLADKRTTRTPPLHIWYRLYLWTELNRDNHRYLGKKNYMQLLRPPLPIYFGVEPTRDFFRSMAIENFIQFPKFAWAEMCSVHPFFQFFFCFIRKGWVKHACRYSIIWFVCASPFLF